MIDMLNQRFAMVNFEQAKADVLPYIKDSSKLDLWSQEFFAEISKDLQGVEEAQGGVTNETRLRENFNKRI